jgi:hypothetical protein
MNDVPKKLARNGVIIGEFTQVQITEGLKAGLIQPSDHVWDEKNRQWLSISEIAGLNKEADKAMEKGLLYAGYLFLLLLVPIFKGKSYLYSFKSSTIMVNERVLLWTGVAIFVALIFYVLICASRSRYRWHFWPGYFSVIAVVGLAGISQTPAVQKYWGDNNPLREPLGYEIWGDIEEEMFPSFELAFAKLNMKEIGPEEKDPNNATRYEQSAQGSTVGVRLWGIKKGDEYEITLVSDGYRPLLIDKSVYKFTAIEDAATAVAYPDLNFNYSMLRENRQTRFFKIIATVKRNKGTPLTQMKTWQLRQINDCLLIAKGKVLQKNGSVRMEAIKIAPLTLSGFVNENHPAIPGILESALRTNIVDRFSGLQGNSDEHVLRQLAAIWAALEKEKLSYSSIAATTPSVAFVQHVRMIDDTLKSSQANCVDGSVLFASVAYKIGLDPQLVLSPGHCYVAIRLPSGNMIGIEMTAIGRKSFGEAIEIATSKSQASLENNRSKFDAADPSTGYMIVSISGCRKLGIQPIPASK